ncbi:MAG: family 43 glycosylhydrolase [Bacteroidales bacterium]|nr:family 43 glycosylhydrolase [Bacteroidales bacterium]
MRNNIIFALFVSFVAAVAIVIGCSGGEENSSPQKPGLIVITPGTNPGEDNPGSGGDNQGGDNPGTGGDEEALAAYREWNNGSGIQPAPKGVPGGYTPKQYSNPVFGKTYTLPDPTVFRKDGWFYLFATGGNCRIMRSKDLTKWESIGTAFTDAGRPAWLSNEDGSKVGLWAPDINIIDGKYVLFYSLATNNNVRGIGRAVSDKLEGPYTDLGMLIRSNTFGTTGTIDPNYFEYQGEKYLCWGNFSNIYCAQLTDDGLNLKYPGDKSKLKTIAGKNFEGPLIHKRGDWFYFIGSAGTCCKGYDSTYHLQVARAKTPFGPFINKNGNAITGTTQGTTFLEGNTKFIGPGHNAEIVTDDAGDDWLLYHSYINGVTNSKRLLCLDKITWTEDGWPTINDGHPSENATAPVFAD